ncbi:hypothetical protein D3C85_1397960 [compost metagenome]
MPPWIQSRIYPKVPYRMQRRLVQSSAVHHRYHLDVSGIGLFAQAQQRLLHIHPFAVTGDDARDFRLIKAVLWAIGLASHEPAQYAQQHQSIER